MSRTAGSTALHPDWKLHLWLAIQVLCATKLSKTGKKITPRAAVKILGETGGFFGLVGGDYISIAKINAKRRPRLLEMCVIKEQGLLRLKEESRIADKREILSKVFVSHRLEHLRTLLERYYETVRWLKRDPLTEFAWNNILRDRLNIPREPNPWSRAVPFMATRTSSINELIV
jgi:hypothetical protein